MGQFYLEIHILFYCNGYFSANVKVQFNCYVFLIATLFKNLHFSLVTFFNCYTSSTVTVVFFFNVTFFFNSAFLQCDRFVSTSKKDNDGSKTFAGEIQNKICTFEATLVFETLTNVSACAG